MNTDRNILDKALHAFSSIGYEGCGIQQICDAAKITKPTLYHHFGSKRGLLDALVSEISRPLMEGIEGIEYRGDLPATLTDLTGLVFRYAENHPVEFRYFVSLLLAPAGSDSRKSVEKADQFIVGHISGMFARAADDHGNMRGRQVMLTTGFLGMTNMFGTLIADGRLQMSGDQVHQAVRMFSHGIYS